MDFTIVILISMLAVLVAQLIFLVGFVLGRVMKHDAEGGEE